MTNGLAHKCANDATSLRLFLREPTGKGRLLCVNASGDMAVAAFWERFVAPMMGGDPPPAGARLMCAGRTLDPRCKATLREHGVSHLSTLEVSGRLPSQGFPRMHQLMEHLAETLTPVAPPAQATTGSAPAAADDPPALLAREPIMHAIDAEIQEIRSALRTATAGEPPPHCPCMSCTGRPNSTLWLCGALLHSTDAAVVNLTFRVVQVGTPDSTHKANPSTQKPAASGTRSPTSTYALLPCRIAPESLAPKRPPPCCRHHLPSAVSTCCRTLKPSPSPESKPPSAAPPPGGCSVARPCSRRYPACVRSFCYGRAPTVARQ